MASTTMTMRTVESRDPSLSEEGNRLITGELRRVLGRDTIAMPSDAPDHRGTRHATHTAMGASAISVRPLLMLSAGPLALAALIGWAGATTSSWVAVGALFVLMVAGMIGVAEITSRLFDDHEHMDPEATARLQAEGVGDPDHVLTELVNEFSRGR